MIIKNYDLINTNIFVNIDSNSVRNSFSLTKTREFKQSMFTDGETHLRSFKEVFDSEFFMLRVTLSFLNEHSGMYKVCDGYIERNGDMIRVISPRDSILEFSSGFGGKLLIKYNLFEDPSVIGIKGVKKEYKDLKEGSYQGCNSKRDSIIMGDLVFHKGKIIYNIPDVIGEYYILKEVTDEFTDVKVLEETFWSLRNTSTIKLIAQFTSDVFKHNLIRRFKHNGYSVTFQKNGDVFIVSVEGEVLLKYLPSDRDNMDFIIDAISFGVFASISSLRPKQNFVMVENRILNNLKDYYKL